MYFLLLEVIQELLPRSTHDVVDLVDLVELIVARKEGKQREDLKEHASGTPYVHLVPIVAVCKEALWGSVPPS